jgi:hypothetical protein
MSGDNDFFIASWTETHPKLWTTATDTRVNWLMARMDTDNQYKTWKPDDVAGRTVRTDRFDTILRQADFVHITTGNPFFHCSWNDSDHSSTHHRVTWHRSGTSLGFIATYKCFGWFDAPTADTFVDTYLFNREAIVLDTHVLTVEERLEKRRLLEISWKELNNPPLQVPVARPPGDLTEADIAAVAAAGVREFATAEAEINAANTADLVPPAENVAVQISNDPPQQLLPYSHSSRRFGGFPPQT